MRKTKAQGQYHRLRWEGNAPQSEAATITEDETLLALKALAGFHCSDCGKLLSASQGYVCCDAVYCPVCGANMGAGHPIYRTPCAHLVLETYFDTSGETASTERFPLPARDRRRGILTLDAPAKAVTRLDRPEYPVWSDAQIADAYGLLAPLVGRVFGQELRRLDQSQRNRILLETCLRPDELVSLTERGARTSEFYFSTKPEAATPCILRWLEAMRDGTKRLQKMPPQRMAPVWRTSI